MNVIQENSKVTFHYVLKVEDGTEVATSRNAEPMSCTIGDGQLLPDFESALLGMIEGAKKSFELQPDQAYGHRKKELVMTFGREELPADVDFQLNLQIQFPTPEGEFIPGVVRAVDEDSVTIDLNHPLASEVLYFEVEVISVA